CCCPPGQSPVHRFGRQIEDIAVHHAAPAVPKPHDLPSHAPDGASDYGTDGTVQPRTVTSAGQDTYALHRNGSPWTDGRRNLPWRSERFYAGPLVRPSWRGRTSRGKHANEGLRPDRRACGHPGLGAGRCIPDRTSAAGAEKIGRAHV